MTVRDTSKMALEQVQKRLEPDQWAVYSILEEIGPAHDRRILEVLNQKEQMTLKPRQFKRRWEINQVTARRNELVKLQLIKDIGIFSGYYRDEKKTYHFWAVQGDYREPAGWKRLPDKPHTIREDDRCAGCQYRHQQIRQEAEQPVLEKMRISDAGRTLVKHQRNQKIRINGQLVMTF